MQSGAKARNPRTQPSEGTKDWGHSGSLKKATIRIMYVLFGACFFVAFPCYGFIKIESKMIKLKSQK